MLKCGVLIKEKVYYFNDMPIWIPHDLIYQRYITPQEKQSIISTILELILSEL
jgi:hypothetical protein